MSLYAAWQALKQSTWTRFGYWVQNCYPSQSIPAAKMLDEGLHSLLELTVGVSIPLCIDPATIVLDTPIPGREDWSFPAWVMRQPVKCGGMGLRSYVETCGPAFIGAIEMAIPTLHTGFGSILTNEVGGTNRFGEGVQPEGRWRTLLNSGCRVGRELSVAWNSLDQY